MNKILLLLSCAVVACSSGSDPKKVDPNSTDTCVEGNARCLEGTAQNCSGGAWVNTDCQGRSCVLLARGTAQCVDPNADIPFDAATPPGDFATTDTDGDYRPTLASDGADGWMVVWTSRGEIGGPVGTDSDLAMVFSNDGGNTWSAVRAANGNAGADSGGDDNARLAYASGAWVLVWSSSDTLGDTVSHDFDILVATSENNGEYWSYPAPLTADATSDSGQDRDPALATDGDTLMVAWESPAFGGDADVAVSRSSDGGSTWSAPQSVREGALTDTGQDTDPHLAGANDTWVVTWRSDAGSDADIMVAQSVDGGATWNDQVQVSHMGAGDHEPTIATDGAGHWLVAWRSDDTLSGTLGSDYDLLMVRSSDDGATWSEPGFLNANAESDAGSDSQPVLVNDGGIWVALWNAKDLLGSDSDVVTARSFDGGESWSAPVAVDASADGDIGNDTFADLATDGTGRWLGAWQSTDDHGGLGTDADILISTADYP